MIDFEKEFRRAILKLVLIGIGIGAIITAVLLKLFP